jgi:adhesin transport system membrane fusion protein
MPDAEVLAAPAAPAGNTALKEISSALHPANVAKSLAREEDLDFMSETSAAAMQGPPMATHWIIWGAVAFVVAFIAWAAYANIGETTVGDGKVIPSSQTQVIQNLEGGIVAEIKVKVGDVVRKNQVVAVIDNTRYVGSVKENKAKDNALLARIARLTAEVQGRPIAMPAAVLRENPDLARREIDLYQSRQTEFAANTAALKQQMDQRTQEIVEKRSRVKQITASLEFLNKEVAISKPMVKSGAVSEVEILRLERQVVDLKGELDSTLINIPRLESAVAEARSKSQGYEAKFRGDAQTELNLARAEQEGGAAMTETLEDRLKRAQVRSSVNGTVKTIKVNTVGGVVQPGADMMEIVPLEDNLLIEARVKPKDIAFLRPGQEALVKISAYDFSIYGGFPATLEQISADTVQDEKKQESFYLVRVRTTSSTSKQTGKPLVIIPGMTATVHIQTGEKTFLHYLLKPIIKTRELAFRER